MMHLNDAVMFLALYGNIDNMLLEKCKRQTIAANYNAHAFKGKETKRRKKATEKRKSNSYKRLNFLTHSIHNKVLIRKKIWDVNEIMNNYPLNQTNYKKFKEFIYDLYNKEEVDRCFSMTLKRMKMRVIINKIKELF